VHLIEGFVCLCCTTSVRMWYWGGSLCFTLHEFCCHFICSFHFGSQLLLLWCSDMGSSNSCTRPFACNADILCHRSCISGTTFSPQ
jgi:hypothetical protein